MNPVQIRDMGNYSCQAENSQGRARDHIELSGEYTETIFSAKLDFDCFWFKQESTIGEIRL